MGAHSGGQGELSLQCQLAPLFRTFGPHFLWLPRVLPSQLQRHWNRYIAGMLCFYLNQTGICHG